MRFRNWILTLSLLLGALFVAACSAATAPNTSGTAATAPSGAAPATAPSAAGTMSTIGVADLKTKLDSGEKLFLLDVRTPDEFTQDGHVAQATLIPLQELETRVGELPADTPIACICRSGNRSNTACTMLAGRGFTVMNVEGGTNAWKAAGYAVEH